MCQSSGRYNSKPIFLMSPIAHLTPLVDTIILRSQLLVYILSLCVVVSSYQSNWVPLQVIQVQQGSYFYGLQYSTYCGYVTFPPCDISLLRNNCSTSIPFKLLKQACRHKFQSQEHSSQTSESRRGYTLLGSIGAILLKWYHTQMPMHYIL